MNEYSRFSVFILGFTPAKLADIILSLNSNGDVLTLSLGRVLVKNLTSLFWIFRITRSSAFFNFLILNFFPVVVVVAVVLNDE